MHHQEALFPFSLVVEGKTLLLEFSRLGGGGMISNPNQNILRNQDSIQF
jgi:hypothetical protein